MAARSDKIRKVDFKGSPFSYSRLQSLSQTLARILLRSDHLNGGP